MAVTVVPCPEAAAVAAPAAAAAAVAEVAVDVAAVDADAAIVDVDVAAPCAASGVDLLVASAPSPFVVIVAFVPQAELPGETFPSNQKPYLMISDICQTRGPCCSVCI